MTDDTPTTRAPPAERYAEVVAADGQYVIMDPLDDDQYVATDAPADLGAMR